MKVAKERDPDTGDLVHHDMGLGFPFRQRSFDGVISISALQWLCYPSSAEQDPRLRLNRFFSSLYSVLKKSARAIFQFYQAPRRSIRWRSTAGHMKCAIEIFAAFSQAGGQLL